MTEESNFQSRLHKNIFGTIMCPVEGHDSDAVHCKFCGYKL